MSQLCLKIASVCLSFVSIMRTGREICSSGWFFTVTTYHTIDSLNELCTIGLWTSRTNPGKAEVVE